MTDGTRADHYRPLSRLRRRRGHAHQCRLELSTQTLTFLTGLLSAQLKKIRSRWRKRPAGRIAVIVLAALRHDQRLADLAGGNGLSRTTVDRWLKEMLDLLAARAPGWSGCWRKSPGRVAASS
ncbi:hypothetical protein [Streptomyces violaceusniger]|uniref:hypothetical protein n=1 Tax=Streptomyces violaceusniger TaxID=68280 RepID=UPI0036A186AD